MIWISIVFLSAAIIGAVAIGYKHGYRECKWDQHKLINAAFRDGTEVGSHFDSKQNEDLEKQLLDYEAVIRELERNAGVGDHDVSEMRLSETAEVKILDTKMGRFLSTSRVGLYISIVDETTWLIRPTGRRDVSDLDLVITPGEE